MYIDKKANSGGWVGRMSQSKELKNLGLKVEQMEVELEIVDSMTTSLGHCLAGQEIPRSQSMIRRPQYMNGTGTGRLAY